MSKKAVVVVPIYRNVFTAAERLSLQQCFKVLSNYNIVAVKPKDLELNELGFCFHEVITFDNEFFRSISGYNRLMCHPIFYEAFLSYDFMLIYQTDAFVFKDELAHWCYQGYDYIGAPWLRHCAFPDAIKRYKTEFRNYFQRKMNMKQHGTDLPTDGQLENMVGNGGFSLRNVRKFHALCLEESETIEYYNSRNEHYFGEDVFWSIEINRRSRRLKIPGYKTAAHFAIENSPQHGFFITHGRLPFGCHAWDRNLNFWVPIFESLNLEVKHLAYEKDQNLRSS